MCGIREWFIHLEALLDQWLGRHLQVTQRLLSSMPMADSGLGAVAVTTRLFFLATVRVLILGNTLFLWLTNVVEIRIRSPFRVDPWPR